MLKKAENTGKNRTDESSDEEDNDGSNLFGGLLGSGGDNILDIKAKKLAKKKEIIQKMKAQGQMIHAFQAYDTVIKADPLVVMKQLTQLKAQQNSEQPTRRDESKKLPALKQARSTDTRTKLTAPRQVSPASLLVTPLFSSKQSPMSRNVKAAFATTGTDRLENKPLRQAVRSERELEQLDQSRHNDYKLYWHFQEFNPVDL